MEHIIDIIFTIIGMVSLIVLITFYSIIVSIDIKTKEMRKEYKNTLSENEKTIINKYLDIKATYKDVFKKKEKKYEKRKHRKETKN